VYLHLYHINSLVNQSVSQSLEPVLLLGCRICNFSRDLSYLSVLVLVLGSSAITSCVLLPILTIVLLLLLILT